MDVLLVPRAEVRQVLVDLETFIDLGLWRYLYQAMAELEEILGEGETLVKKERES